MKICCDRCEKSMENNIFGNPIGGKTYVTRGLIGDEKIILCKSCEKAFRQFLEGGDSNE